MTISATTQGIRPGVATSSTRPAVPFDGQVISETDTDTLQVYKGSAWAPVSGLQLISRTTSGPSATIAYDNVFSSTYSSYMVVLESVSGSSTAYVYLKFRYAGPTTQSATYYYAGNGLNTSGAAANLYGANFNQVELSTCSSEISRSTIMFYGVGNTSEKPYFTSQSFTNNGDRSGRAIGGIQDTARTYTGFELSLSTGNITATTAIYGLAKS